MAYYERHGICDGSVLTIPLRSLLSGDGPVALQRSRDFRVVGDVSFPLARTREWQQIIRSAKLWTCLLYTSPSPRDRQKSRMPSSA